MPVLVLFVGEAAECCVHEAPDTFNKAVAHRVMAQCLGCFRALKAPEVGHDAGHQFRCVVAVEDEWRAFTAAYVLHDCFC